MNIETKTHWWEDLNNANQVGAAFIMQNNIRVTFYTFAFGAMLGLGTVLLSGVQWSKSCFCSCLNLQSWIRK